MEKNLKPNKPQILLHICCAPDSTAVYERLAPEYEVIGYFHNPNIYPEKEFHRRLDETRKVAQRMGFELVAEPYQPESGLEAIKGWEHEPEKGRRCEICFRINLRAAAQKAASMQIPFFTTTLTISPHKKSKSIFKAAGDAEKEFHVRFLEIDFKKSDGFKRSLEISREMELYRQNYCGCRYSIPEAPAA